MASAASVAENFVLAPISLALARRASNSSPVAPDTAATLLIAESKSAAVFTETTPRAVTAPDTGRSFFPAPEMVSPVCCSLPPTSAILLSLLSQDLASFSSRFSSCSVSAISRCRASYLSCPSSPRSSCSFACFCASFKPSSFSFVAFMESFRSFCFWERSVVFFGSSFRSLFTSRSELCVVRIVLLTPFRALSRPVVSPPISTVIPLILLATGLHLLRTYRNLPARPPSHISRHRLFFLSRYRVPDLR